MFLKFSRSGYECVLLSSHVSPVSAVYCFVLRNKRKEEEDEGVKKDRQEPKRKEKTTGSSGHGIAWVGRVAHDTFDQYNIANEPKVNDNPKGEKIKLNQECRPEARGSSLFIFSPNDY